MNDKLYKVEYDGMIGTIVGTYTTREGREGVVIQQQGTRIIHVIPPLNPRDRRNN